MFACLSNPKKTDQATKKVIPSTFLQDFTLGLYLKKKRMIFKDLFQFGEYYDKYQRKIGVHQFRGVFNLLSEDGNFSTKLPPKIIQKIITLRKRLNEAFIKIAKGESDVSLNQILKNWTEHENLMKKYRPDGDWGPEDYRKKPEYYAEHADDKFEKWIKVVEHSAKLPSNVIKPLNDQQLSMLALLDNSFVIKIFKIISNSYFLYHPRKEHLDKFKEIQRQFVDFFETVCESIFTNQSCEKEIIRLLTSIREKLHTMINELVPRFKKMPTNKFIHYSGEEKAFFRSRGRWVVYGGGESVDVVREWKLISSDDPRKLTSIIEEVFTAPDYSQDRWYRLDILRILFAITNNLIGLIPEIYTSKEKDAKDVFPVTFTKKMDESFKILLDKPIDIAIASTPENLVISDEPDFYSELNLLDLINRSYVHVDNSVICVNNKSCLSEKPGTLDNANVSADDKKNEIKKDAVYVNSGSRCR